MNEVWATVCGTGFTDEMAAAACTGIGLSSDGEHIHLVDSLWNLIRFALDCDTRNILEHSSCLHAQYILRIWLT